MGDPSTSQAQNSYNTIGISKSASLAEICKAYRSLVSKWHPDRNPSNKADAQAKFTSINEAYRALSMKKRDEANAWSGDRKPKTHNKKKSYDHEKQDEEELQISKPTLLSRTTSRISPLTSPTGTPTKHPISLSRVASLRCNTPIFFSQSAARKKPQPIERKIECTLEELCLGCVKKVKITRDAISSSGLIVEEEEILMVQVKPGWKTGTKITFEGKGDERPGSLPADIIFSIDEKRHPLFKRKGDDLELGIEVPLVQVLTGCTIPIPLLGGDKINLSIHDIIYPGYVKVIPGQGMPIPKQGKRGDLRLKFEVEFPTELTDDQRSEIVRILEECS